MGEPFKLYASKETKATIPAGDLKLMEKLLPQWAGENVILVSAADIVSPSKLAKGTSPENLYTPAFRSFTGSLPLERRDTSGKEKPDVLQDAYKKAATHEFAAVETNAFKSTGMMTVPVKYSDMNKYIPAGLAGLPQSMVGHVPGSPTDWLMVTAAHESGHLASVQSDAIALASMGNKYSIRDTENLHTNDREIAADSKGMTNYFNLCGQQTTFNPKVPQAYMALRAIGTLRLSGDTLNKLNLSISDHETSPAITIKGNAVQPQPKMTSGAIGADVMDINTKVHLLLGIEMQDHAPDQIRQWAKAQTEGILSSVSNPAVKEKAAESGVTPAALFGAAIGKERTDLIQKMNADPQAKQAMTTLIIGSGYAKQDPMLEYAAMKFLYSKNEFKTPEEKKIAKDYIDAFEKYVPAANNSKEVKAAMTQMAKDWPQVQKIEKDGPGMKYIQQSLDVTRRQLTAPDGTAPAQTPVPVQTTGSSPRPAQPTSG